MVNKPQTFIEIPQSLLQIGIRLLFLPPLFVETLIYQVLFSFNFQILIVIILIVLAFHLPHHHHRHLDPLLHPHHHPSRHPPH